MGADGAAWGRAPAPSLRYDIRASQGRETCLYDKTQIQGQRGPWRLPECLGGWAAGGWGAVLQTKGSIDPPPLPWPGLSHNGTTFRGFMQLAPSLSSEAPRNVVL